MIVVKHLDVPCNMKPGRDLWYHDEMSKASSECPAVNLKAEDPLFILYTSGSTGKPKGVVHTQAGSPFAVDDVINTFSISKMRTFIGAQLISAGLLAIVILSMGLWPMGQRH